MNITFDKLSSFATDTANCVFANRQKKEIVRDNIMGYFAAVCIAYNNDKYFKNEMDAYIEYLKRTL